MNRDLSELTPEEQAVLLEAVDEAGGDPTAREQIAKAMQTQSDILNWAKGTGSGMYVINLPDGSSISLPSPKQIAEDAADSSLTEDPGDLVLIFENKLI